MNFKIHRGTHEIGGSCIEVWTDTTRIILDFGMPLVEKNGGEFDFKKYKELSPQQLVEKGVLPNIEGLYDRNAVDGVIISHAHQDHYGLINYIHPEVQYYLGEATHTLLKLNTLFTPQEINLKNTTYFESEKSFNIGDITITPYLNDHSAFDAYSFLVEADGKSLFYSGDFRGHGRKAKAFQRFLNNAPKNVDFLLLEGTTISRSHKPVKTEKQIEEEMVKLFQQEGKINLIYTSGQNIDRLVSIIRASIRTGKTLVMDVYVATVFKEISNHARIPYPGSGDNNLRVIFPHRITSKMIQEGNKNLVYQFTKAKITREEISEHPERYVMLVRPSLRSDLDRIHGINGGNFIYSMWEGYLKSPYTSHFVDYLTNRGFSLHKIHTSGHADTKTLQKMVETMNPRHLIPIHTFESKSYQSLFDVSVVELEDGEEVEV